MKKQNVMRDFELEVFFSKHEFTAQYHMTASDVESRSLAEVLSFASETDREAFENLWLGYTETWGAPELRNEISKTYECLKSENVLCLAGAGEGLYIAAQVLLTEEDHVIVPTPNYQSAETVPLSICEVTGVPMRRDSAGKHEWSLELDDLKAVIRPNTKLLSLNFPNNPTGMLLPYADIQALIELCRERNIYILCDEVYRGLELRSKDQLPQMADLYEKGISLNVMSKAYGLPGLRIGWIATQDQVLLQKMERYKHYLSICNSGPSEQLTLIALKARQEILRQNRALLLENLILLEALFDDFPGLVEWRRPMGGCVAYPKYTGSGGSEEFCRSLIEESGVLLLPASIYVSEVSPTPQNHFRLGFGRNGVFKAGVVALRAHFEKKYPSFRK